MSSFNKILYFGLYCFISEHSSIKASNSLIDFYIQIFYNLPSETLKGFVKNVSNNVDKISEKYAKKSMDLEKALAKGKPVAVLFYADWCGFCKRFAPTFAELAKDRDLKKKYTLLCISVQTQVFCSHLSQEMNSVFSILLHFLNVACASQIGFRTL